MEGNEQRSKRLPLHSDCQAQPKRFVAGVRADRKETANPKTESRTGRSQKENRNLDGRDVLRFQTSDAEVSRKRLMLPGSAGPLRREEKEMKHGHKLLWCGV